MIIRFFTGTTSLLLLLVSITTLAANVEIQDKNNPQAYIDYAKSVQKNNPRLAHKILDEAYSLAKLQQKPAIAGRALLEHAQTSKLSKNYLLAQQYLIRAEAVSTQLTDSVLSVDILSNMSTVHRYLHNYEKSMDYVQRSLTEARKSHEPLLIFKCLQIKGALLEEMKRYDDALESYLLAQRYISGATNEQIVRLLRSTADGYIKVNEFDSAIRYYRRAVKLLEEANDNNKEIPKTLVDLAKTQSKKGDYSGAIKNGNRALALSRELKQEKYILRSLVGLSIVYRKISSYEEALSNGLEALDIYQDDKNYDGIAASANSIGLSYMHLEQNDNAKNYFTQVLDIPEEKINLKYRAASLRDLGRIFFNENAQQKGLNLTNEAHEIYEKLGNRNGVATVEKNLGFYHFKMGNLAESKHAYRSAIELFKKIHDVWNEAASTAQLATVLIEDDLDKSILLAQKSLSLATNIGAKSVLESAYNALILAEEKRKNYKTALLYARKKEAIINEIKTDAVNKRSAEMYIILDVEKKERAFEILKREKAVISLELDNKEAKLSLLEKEKRIDALQRQNTLIIVSVSIVAVVFALLFLGRIYLNMNYRFIIIITLAVIFLLYSVNSNSMDIIKLTQGQSTLDVRPKYTLSILKEALQQSSDKYGDFEIKLVNEYLSNEVKRWEVYDGTTINLTMAMTSPDWEYLTIPIRIPIRRGLGSYRLLAINKKDQQQFTNITTIEQLKTLTVGLQKEWIMNDIFEEEGFKIVEASTYDGVFKMLNKQRFDFIPRGIYEIYDELSLREGELSHLMVEPNIMLYIPQPFYIFVSPKYPEIAARIEFGLEKMIAEGILQKMFNEHYSNFIKKANLSKRTVINVGNKYLTKKTPFAREELWLKFDLAK